MSAILRELPKRPPQEPLDSLGAIVRDFTWRYPRERRDRVVEFCRAAPDFQTAIRRAVASLDANGKMHLHAVRIHAPTKREYMSVLLAYDGEEGALYQKAREFDGLHDTLWDLRVWGIGPVMVYDVATRLAAYHGEEPRSVYLHAGVAQGLRALARATERAAPVVSGRILAPDLHTAWPEFASLTPDEVEDLLCTYRDVFPRIKEK